MRKIFLTVALLAVSISGYAAIGTTMCPAPNEFKYDHVAKLWETDSQWQISLASENEHIDYFTRALANTNFWDSADSYTMNSCWYEVSNDNELPAFYTGEVTLIPDIESGQWKPIEISNVKVGASCVGNRENCTFHSGV